MCFVFLLLNPVVLLLCYCILLFCSCILAFCYWNLQTALLSFRFEILLLKTALLLLLCSEGVIHLGQTPSLICRILHILRKPNSIIAKYTYSTRSCRLFVCYLWDISGKRICDITLTNICQCIIVCVCETGFWECSKSCLYQL